MGSPVGKRAGMAKHGALRDRFRRTVIVVAALVAVGLVAWCVRSTSVMVRPAPDRHRARCQVHGNALRLDHIRITYAVPPILIPYYNAERRYFPNACTVFYGGDVVGSDSPAEQQVWYCPACRAAEERWLQKHPGEGPSGR